MMQGLRQWAYRLLRRTETYFKTDMVSLTKSGFWLAAAQGVAAVTSFLLSIAFAYFLPQEVYGHYKFFLSVAAIISAVSLTGLSIPVTQLVAQGKERALRIAFRQNIRWSIPLMLVAAAGVVYYLLQDNILLAYGVAVIGLCAPFINGGGLYSAFWSGKSDFRTYALYWVAVNSTTALAILLCMFLTHSEYALVTTYFVVSAVTNMIAYMMASRSISAHKATADEDKIVSYSLHLSAINLLQTITSQIDRILVFHYVGAAGMAVYAFAIAIPDQVRAVLKGAARIALPKFATRSLDSIQQTLTAKLLRFGVVILVLTALYVIAAPYIFMWLFPKYMESVPYSQLLAATIITVLGSMPLAALQAHSATRELYQHAVFMNIIQIVLTVTLIANYGLMGAVWATIATRFISLVVPSVLLAIRKERS